MSLGEYDLFASSVKDNISNSDSAFLIVFSASSNDSIASIAHPLITTSCPGFSSPRRSGMCSMLSCGKLTSNKSQQPGISLESCLASLHSVR